MFYVSRFTFHVLRFMDFNYLTDESEKTLVPFFSPVVLSAIFKGIVIVSGFLLVFWPQNFASFIGQNKTPLVFAMVFTITLIILSYINLCCGRGEMAKSRTLFHEYPKLEKTVTFERENDFLQYGLIGFLLHTVFLLLPFLPLLMLSTSVSGVSLSVFGKACSVVFTASLLCRLAGFIAYTFWGRMSSVGFLLTRVFLGIFLFGTLILAPTINPVLVLYELNNSLPNIGVLLKSSYSIYITTVGLTIGMFVAMSQILVRYYIKKES